MKKIIKVAILTILVGMPLSIQALTFWDLVAVWLIAKTVERVARVSECSNPCCTCECKKNFQCRVRWLKKNQNKKLKEKGLMDSDNHIVFVVDDQDEELDYQRSLIIGNKK